MEFPQLCEFHLSDHDAANIQHFFIILKDAISGKNFREAYKTTKKMRKITERSQDLTQDSNQQLLLLGFNERLVYLLARMSRPPWELQKSCFLLRRRFRYTNCLFKLLVYYLALKSEARLWDAGLEAGYHNSQHWEIDNSRCCQCWEYESDLWWSCATHKPCVDIRFMGPFTYFAEIQSWKLCDARHTQACIFTGLIEQKYEYFIKDETIHHCEIFTKWSITSIWMPMLYSKQFGV